MHRALFFIVTVAFLLVGIAASRAMAGAPRVSRALKNIDFEERKLGNDEDLPMHWVKVEGNGLPHYVNGMLATDRIHGGQYSFRFDLNGGSLIYRYDPAQIPVQAGAHYRIDCFCQTTPLPNARARVTAYFIDQDGHALAATVHHSDLYAAETDGQDWHRLNVELTANDPKAAFLVVELGLLQPALYAPAILGDRTLRPQDIRGSAWFDDLTVSQVPQVMLNTDRPGNIFRRGDPLRLSVIINDKFTDDLSAKLTMTDAAGSTVFQRSGAMDMAGAQTLGPSRKQLALKLPDLRPGWYRAALEMSSHGQFVGEQTADLIVLADAADPTQPDRRFGLIATDLPFEGWEELPKILPFLGAGRVKLAVWGAQGDVEQMDSLAFDSLLEDLQSLGIKPTACLTSLPPAVADHVGGTSWTKLIDADPASWQPQLAYLISRHASHLDRWQLGADGSDAFVVYPKMREVYRSIFNQFSLLMQSPDLAMPWPAWYDLAGELPVTVALSVPSEVLPNQIPLYMQEFTGKAARGHNLSLSLQPLDPRYGREVCIRDLAQRVTYALAGGATRIDLPLPFTVRKENEQIIKEPSEMLLVDRTLITTLANATYKGKVPIAEGVEAFLFDRDGQGILMLWNRASDANNKQLAINLGAMPMKVDLWGNVTPLPHPDDARASDTVQLDVGPMPFFLTDIDGIAAQLRASVGFDRPLVESSFQPHPRRLHFTNPSQSPISGSLRLRAPKGWSLTPASFPFSLAPGETLDREISIEFPYNSFAGAKTIDADFAVQGTRNSNFTVPLTITLGLSDVGIQSLAFKDGQDLLVQQMITNYGERAINYTAYAIYPGQPRQERLVSDLPPGRTTIKLYRFINVKFVPNAKVRCGVRELEGTRVLNDEVEIQ